MVDSIHKLPGSVHLAHGSLHYTSTVDPGFILGFPETIAIRRIVARMKDFIKSLTNFYLAKMQVAIHSRGSFPIHADSFLQLFAQKTPFHFSMYPGQSYLLRIAIFFFLNQYLRNGQYVDEKQNKFWRIDLIIIFKSDHFTSEVARYLHPGELVSFRKTPVGHVLELAILPLKHTDMLVGRSLDNLRRVLLLQQLVFTRIQSQSLT